MEIEVAPDGPALAEEAADWMAGEIERAIAVRGRAAIAVSGGSTPNAMFAALARRRLPWNQVHVFQVDERVAPDGDADRNATTMVPALVEAAGIPAENVHLMAVTDTDLEGAARRYERELRRHGDGVLDVVHLGIGVDGHTASWPPGDAVVDVVDRDVAIVGPFNGRRRMTLTVPAVNRARCIMLLVAGADKAIPLRRALAEDHAMPASRVRHTDLLVFADRAAAQPE
ncbi:MAG: 6-phosphogluconolactonase [Acidimicrobiia bacterium]